MQTCSLATQTQTAAQTVGQFLVSTSGSVILSAEALFDVRRGVAPVSADKSPDRLYGEIGRLKMELDWLKKKSGMSLS